MDAGDYLTTVEVLITAEVLITVGALTTAIVLAVVNPIKVEVQATRDHPDKELQPGDPLTQREVDHVSKISQSSTMLRKMMEKSLSLTTLPSKLLFPWLMVSFNFFHFLAQI